MIGAVLAGGKARRFGGNKLLYRINGKSLIEHTVERLRMASGINRVILVTSRENTELGGLVGADVLVDELLIGPLGGLYTALEVGDVFAVAGDMPALVPELIDEIIRRFNESGKMACVPLWPNGYIEPLHAAYSSAIRPLIEERIRLGSYSINSLVRSIDACYIRIDELPEEWKESFFNVNTKRDLELWRR